MAASSARIRLGLYGVVLVALIAAAIVALFSLGNDGTSKAADPPLSTGPVASTTSAGIAAPTTSAAAPTTSAAAPSSTSVAPVTSSSAPKSTSSAPKTSLSSTRPVSGTQKKAAKAKVYTVKRGDNLTVIAAWFHVRGFEPLYAWNKTVIGQNPDLIFPGQKIIVAPGGMVSVSNG